ADAECARADSFRARQPDQTASATHLERGSMDKVQQRGAPLDRMLRPVHRWVWGDFDRRVRKLIAFAHVEGDGGRDILRAAEVTPDPLLRRLYLEHAIDELRHSDLFRKRGTALLRSRSIRASSLFNATPLPGGHGLDDLAIDGEPDYRLLAFLHVAEKAAAGRFEIY